MKSSYPNSAGLRIFAVRSGRFPLNLRPEDRAAAGESRALERIGEPPSRPGRKIDEEWNEEGVHDAA